MSSGHLRLHVPMRARTDDASHRVATPFELLFDLIFVVAVASLVSELSHATVAGHLTDAVVPFLFVFFAIWWAWMNFTWFSSGYDPGDVLYRVLGVVQMAGVLVLAAGVPAAFERFDFTAVTIGYLVMRIGLVGLWVRAAVEHPETRAVSLRYVAGIVFGQVLWVLRLVLFPDFYPLVVFLVLALVEVSVPVWANRAGRDPWHPGHIAERYGLFVIILLGEGVLAATNGVRASLEASGVTAGLVVVGIAGLVILVGLWWVYFLHPAGEGLAMHRGRSFLWGYGHYALFACVAAVGAGLEVAVEVAGHHTDVPPMLAGTVVAAPVAAVLVLTWALHRPLVERSEVPGAAVLVGAVLIVAAGLATPVIGLPAAIAAIALLTAGIIGATLVPARAERG
ncbi:MAG: low temperature requirement protein A [Microbacteriaceae bacterium]|nr:low temperature requirement protein A [Microbacteriaceae bacterium]